MVVVVGELLVEPLYPAASAEAARRVEAAVEPIIPIYPPVTMLRKYLTIITVNTILGRV